MKLRSIILLIVMLALVNPMFYLSKDKEKKKSKDTVIEIVFMIMFPPKAP